MIRLRVLDGELLREILSYEVMQVALRAAMVAASQGHCVMPLRSGVMLPNDRGVLAMMPGYLGSSDVAGIKLISLVPPERRGGRSSHLGLMLLYDAEGLQPLAMLCGSTLTSLRTAAVTALATDVLARREVDVLAILGTGEQAHAHVLALAKVRRFSEIRIWGRSESRASELVRALSAQGMNSLRVCESVAAAVTDADVICTVTSAITPVLPGALVRRGAHVNLVGACTRDAAEADGALVGRSTFFVDSRASAMAQAGELLQAIASGEAAESTIAAEIGQVLCGAHPGRTSPSEITVYKSLGIAAQDLAVAHCAYRLAESRGVGTLVSV